MKDNLNAWSNVANTTYTAKKNQYTNSLSPSRKSPKPASSLKITNVSPFQMTETQETTKPNLL